MISPSRMAIKVFQTRPPGAGLWMHISVTRRELRLASSSWVTNGPSSVCAERFTISGSVMSRASMPSGSTSRLAPPAFARAIRSRLVRAFSSQRRLTAN